MGEGANGDGRFWRGDHRGFETSGGDVVCDASVEGTGVDGVEPMVTVGPEGTEGRDGSFRSLDMRFDVTAVGEMAIPAFCKARIRSAMLPPAF